MAKKYKLKTYKAAAKRFRITKTGKIMRSKGGKSHLRRKKNRRVKYLFDTMIEVENSSSKKRIQKLIPYAKKGN